MSSEIRRKWEKEKRRKGSLVKWKRLFCIGIAASMLSQGLPVAWMQAEAAQTESSALQAQDAGERAASGSLAFEDYQYAALEDGTVEITKYTGSDTEVVVPGKIDGKSVTRIKDAFANNTDIVRVELPEGLKEIEGFAFSGCYNLGEIVLPEGLERIEGIVFQGCDGLKDVRLPESLREIEGSAFIGCSGLEKIELPPNLEKIEVSAFIGCNSLAKIDVSAENVNYSSENGLLYDLEKTRLIVCPGGMQGEVELAETVKEIGEYAFERCDDLMGVALPRALEKIGNYAFCECRKLEKIELPERVAEIGEGAFNGCENLSWIGVSEKNMAYSSEEGKLYDKGKTELLICPKKIEGVAKLPESVVAIGESAFNECGDLTGIDFPDGLEKIGERAFYGCEGITELKFPESLTEIGRGAFEQCGGIADIELPSNLKTIEDHVFTFCVKLRNVVIPENVSKIGKQAFWGCSSLERIELPEGLEELEGEGNESPFANCRSLVWIDVAENNLNYSSEDGILYDKEKENLLICPNGRGGNVKLPEGVRKIEDEAFWDCQNITGIELPESLEEIGWFSFYRCVGLEELELKGNQQSIYDDAFYWCDNLNSIYIPNNVTSIGTDAFERCGTDLTVYGDSDSYAEGYCASNGIPFVSLDNGVICNFDAAGGNLEEGENAKTVYFHEPYGALPEPSRAGFRFAGWHTAAKGGEEVTDETDVSAYREHTLYAHWEREGNLLASYGFSEEDLEDWEIEDLSGNGFYAKLNGESAAIAEGILTLPGGGPSSDAAYLELPGEIFENQDTLTINVWLKNQTRSDYYSAMYFGTKSKYVDSSYSNESPMNYWLLSPAEVGDVFKSVWTDADSASAPFSTETMTSDVKTGTGWAMYTTVITPDSITGYYNGVEACRDSKTKTTTDFGTDLVAYVGRSPYYDDFYEGGVYGIEIYGEELTGEEVLDCYYEQMAQPELAKGIAENLTEDDIRGENESLGEVCHDLTFPKEKDGLSLNWESSDESVIGNDGDYRYDGLEEQTITVTAIAMHDDQEIYRKSFDVTVKSVGKTELDAFNAMEIPNADHIKGNITLPVQGIAGSPIIWESSEEDVISVEAQGDVPGGIVTRQEEDVKVTLTATLMQGSGDVSREFELTVKKKPSLDATTDYVFAYYKGYGEGQEKIYFAASRDGLTWGEMNGGDPILESTLGTTGLRDPYLFRSPEGDKFYLLATDLSAYQGNGVVSRNGSQAVMVWESDDLVHWGEQRMVEVAAGIDAGCAWAPEACYDETTQEYLLFWASTTPADNYGKQQVYYCKTRDFHTFTEPKLWIESENSVIDVTVAKDPETGDYYRICVDYSGYDAYIERSDSLLGEWTRVKDGFAHDLGPILFAFNSDDVETANAKWGVAMDAYASGGYYFLGADRLESEDYAELETSLPTVMHHGSVLNITADEYDALVQEYGVEGLEPEEQPEFQYEELEDGTLELTEYTGSASVVTVPDEVNGKSVKKIGENAFSLNDAIEKIEIPGSVEEISRLAFYGCGSLTEIEVSGDNPEYSSQDGILYDKEKTELICFPSGKGGKVEILGGVTRIGENAFYENSRITEVSIQEGVEAIGASAFDGCDKLLRADLPESLRSIGEFAFWGCVSMESAYIPKQVSSIELSFSGCSEGLEIYGYSESAAEEYCNEDGIVFVSLDNGVKCSLDAAGGSLEEGDYAAYYRQPYGQMPEPSRDGYVFAGWYTEPEGGEEVTAQTVVSDYRAHTLYAHWEADRSVKSIRLDKTELSLEVGEEYLLAATIEPSDAYDEVSWRSDQPGVANVGADGKVRALKPGTATITATAGGKSADCVVTVSERKQDDAGDGDGGETEVAVTKVTVSPASLSLEVGEKQKLSVQISPSGASGQKVAWASSNEEAASVSQDGTVTANAVGTATITATAGGKSADCVVTVSERKQDGAGDGDDSGNAGSGSGNTGGDSGNAGSGSGNAGETEVAVTKVTVSPVSLSLEIGEKRTLAVSISPSNATDQAVVWTSSNKNVAVVDVFGNVTANAEGSATITATASNGLKASCKVSVKKKAVAATKVTGIKLNKSSLNLKVGKKYALRAVVSKTGSGYVSVSWSVNNAKIASVSRDGVVTAKKAGKTVVTVKAGGLKLSCAVKVSNLPKPKVSAKLLSYNSVKVSWKRLGDAQGYGVYRSTSKNGSYKKIKTVGKNVTSIKDAGMKGGKSYYYKVAVYVSVGGKKIYGEKSAASKKIVLGKPSDLSGNIVFLPNHQARITWSVKNAQKVQIEKREDNGGYKIWKKVNASEKKAVFSYDESIFRQGHTYKFRIRAYRVVNGKKYYSNYVNLQGFFKK